MEGCRFLSCFHHGDLVWKFLVTDALTSFFVYCWNIARTRAMNLNSTEYFSWVSLVLGPYPLVLEFICVQLAASSAFMWNKNHGGFLPEKDSGESKNSLLCMFMLPLLVLNSGRIARFGSDFEKGVGMCFSQVNIYGLVADADPSAGGCACNLQVRWTSQLIMHL